MMMVSQAFTILKALCDPEPLEYDEYISYLGKYDPKKVYFNMHEDYEKIISRDPMPESPDSVWIDENQNTIVIKGDSEWKVEVRVYRNKEFFQDHVAKFKEMDRMVNQ